MKRIGLMAAAAVLLSGSAYAADLRGGLKDSPAPDSSEAPTVNWTGLYIGGQAGVTDTVIGDDNGAGGLALDGFTGGGRIGFDIQRGRFVFGPFAEYNFSNSSLEAFGSTFLEKNDDWSIGGRLGFLLTSRVLVYGSLAYTQGDFSSPVFGGDSITLDGVSGAVGLETALGGGFSLGLEGKYTDYVDDQIPDGVSFTDKSAMAVLRYKLGFGNVGF